MANVFALSPKPGAPIWPIGVVGPRVLPVWAHSSYATYVQGVEKVSDHGTKNLDKRRNSEGNL
jgi:hypothetical protein